nr:MAG TPA: hypothetical protein [Microviridae sp.]
MINKYTFIFEIGWRDPQTGRIKPYEYRKKSQMSINDARCYCRRLANTFNVIHVCFYKEMH